jgi:predicted aspartyl protease
VQLESPTILIRGEKSQVSFEGLQIDPEAFFTILPMEILLIIGAPSTSLRVAIDLEDGRSFESSVYSVGFRVRGRTGASLAVAFESARPVLGCKFLEDLGLRVNPKSGLLELRGPHVTFECEE